MMDFNNKKFVLNDDKEYEVIEFVEFDNRSYLYLVNVDSEEDSCFKEFVDSNGEFILDDIDPDLFENNIFPLFIDKFVTYADEDKSIKKYRMYEELYKYIFEKYIMTKVDLKKYDDLISNSDLGFGDITKKINLKSGLDEYLNLNHIFILNRFYINKLNSKDWDIITNGSVEDKIKVVESTYKDVIKYDIKNGLKAKINYTYSTSDDSFSDNDQLVIGIYYGNNKIKYEDGDKYLENSILKKKFLSELSEKMINDFKNNMDISVKILFEKK